MTKNPKLTAFLTKLADGRYTSISYARSALGGTVGLSEEDKTEAREAITDHFNSKKAAPAQEPEKEIQTAEAVRRTFLRAEGTFSVGLSALLDASERGPYSNADLDMLLKISLEKDALGAFTKLFHRNAGQVTPSMFITPHFAASGRFFDFISAIFSTPSALREDTMQAVAGVLVREIERRASDEEQVAAFERFLTNDVASRAPLLGADPFTTLVVSFATPVFAQRWLLEHDHSPQSVHEFAHRMMALYLADETTAASLVTLIDTLEPERPVVEEIVRVLLAQRQLGDAIYIANLVPEAFKPQLHKILRPVVRDHGDPLSLVAFGAAFKGLADRDEIKELIQRFLKPEMNERIDALLDGVDPIDTFESVPSVLPPEEQAHIRSTLMRNLGLPVRESRQASGGMPPFLSDLLSKIGRQASHG